MRMAICETVVRTVTLVGRGWPRGFPAGHEEEEGEEDEMSIA